MQNLGAKNWGWSLAQKRESEGSRSIAKGQDWETVGKTGPGLVGSGLFIRLCSSRCCTDVSAATQITLGHPFCHHFHACPLLLFPSPRNTRSPFYVWSILKLRQQIWGLNTLALEPDCLDFNLRSGLNHPWALSISFKMPVPQFPWL